MSGKRTSLGRIVLIVSLGVNLLIAGAVIGFFSSGQHKAHRLSEDAQATDAGSRKPGGVRGGPVLLWAIIADLDNREKRAFLRQVAEKQREAGLGRGRTAGRTEALSAAVAAVPFDIAGVEAVLGEQRGENMKRMQVSHDVITQALRDMTDAQRAVVAERILRVSGRRGPKRDRD